MADLTDFLQEASDPQAPAPTQGSGFGSWYSGEDDKAKLGFSVNAPIETTPDRSARVLSLEAKTGLPSDLIDRNLDTVEKASAADGFDPDAFMKSNPVIGKWMSENPHRAAVTKDDLEGIAKIEHSVQDYGLARSLSNTFLKHGLPSLAATIGRSNAALYAAYAFPYNTIAKMTGGKQAEIPPELLNNDVTRYWEDIASRNSPQELSEYIVSEFGNGNYTRAVRIAAFKVVGNLPQQAPFVAFALAGMPNVGLAFAGISQGASALDQGVKAGADPYNASANAILQGAIEVWTEGFGTFGLAEKLAKKYGKEAVASGFVGTLKEITKDLGITALGEGNEEFWANILQEASARITGVDKSPFDWRKSLQDAGDAFIVGAASAMSTTAPGGISTGLIHQMQMESKAKATQDFYLSLGDSVEASKVRQRLPEATRQIVESLTKDGPVENVYVPVEAVEKYFQGEKGDPLTFMQSLGALDAYKEAKDTAGHVKIPLSVWAEKVVGTDHYKGLSNDITFDPSDPTMNQVKEIQARVQEEADKNKGKTPAEAPIVEDVTKKLEGAGFDNRTATTYATLYGERYKTRAAILGVDPFELYKSENIQIARSDLQPTPGALHQPSIPDEIANVFTPNENLTPEAKAMESEAIQYAGQNVEKILTHYEQTHGNEVSTDKFRDYFRPIGFNGLNTPSYHEPAAALRRTYQNRLMERAIKEGKNDIVLMAGGSGAGKTSALSGELAHLKYEKGMIVDSNLSNFKKAKAEIESMLSKGLNPIVTYVYRDPKESWVNGVLHRIISGSDVRTVPLAEHINLHKGAYETALKLSEEFPGRVWMIDNSLGKGNQKLIPVEKMAEKGYNVNKQELINETVKLFHQGKISAEVVQSALAGALSDSEAKRVGEELRLSPRREPPKNKVVHPAIPDFRTLQQSAVEQRGESRVMFEVAPDPTNTEIKSRWDALDKTAKFAISRDIVKKVLPQVLKEIGVKAELKEQLGGYENDTSPSYTIVLPKNVSPAKFVEATKMTGFVFSQEGMMAVSEKPFGEGKEMRVIRIDLHASDFDSVHNIYQQLREITVDGKPVVSGHTTLGKAMAIVYDETEGPISGDELGALIDKKLGGGYTVTAEHTNVWFADKKEFGYDVNNSSKRKAPGRRSSVQRDAHSLREETTRLLDDAITRHERTHPRGQTSQEVVPPAGPAPAQSQVPQTETPAFKKWFGDSKVVDEKGQPLVVYRGDRPGKTLFTGREDKTAYIKGNIFFSSNPNIGKFYTRERSNPHITPERMTNADGLYRVYLSLENPLVVDAKGNDWMSIPTPALVRRQWRSDEIQIDDLARIAKKIGHDGLIVKDVLDQSGDGDQYVAFRPEQIKSATGNRGTFDPNNPNILMQAAPEGPRGQISFGQNKINIDLFQKADLSTLLHETGHLWMNEFVRDVASVSSRAAGDLTTQQRQLVDDAEAIKKFLGTDSLENLSVAQHEKWAKASEAYFMEGKAPSSALRQAFARFRAWLISVYKTVRGLNVQVPDDLRGVMDRMVASQEEIDMAMEEQQIKPLFEDAKAAGLSEDQAKSYSMAITDAKATAEEELTSKLMDEVKREQTKKWVESRQSVQEEIANEINQRPEYIALAILQRGALPSDTGRVPEGLQSVKLSKDAIVKTYGKEWLDRLPKPYVYSVEGGIHPEQAAEVFGFPSGEALLTALANATPKDALIKTLVDQRMKVLHGDLMTDGTIAEEAMKAVHNDKRAELLRKELEILADKSFSTLKGTLRGMIRRPPTIEAVRSEAEATIAAKAARDISPSFYQRAESKAAREAVEFTLKGDFAQAFDSKRRELVNHELYRAAATAKGEIASIVEYMKRFDNDNLRAKIGKAGGEYLDQIDAISDRYDFRKSVTLTALDKRKSLMAWVMDQTKMGFDVQVPEAVLNEARRRHYKDTSYEELQGVRDTVKTIEHLAKLKNELLANERNRTLEEARAEIISEIQATHKGDKSKYPISPTLADKVKEFGSDFVASHTKIEFLFDYLDGKPLGALYQNLWKPFLDAKAMKAERMQDAMKRLNDIFSVYTRQERATWYYKRTMIPEIGEHLNKAAMMAVALNWGNQYNREALMKGYNWRPDQVNAILDRLDQRDWQTVQNLWDFIDTYWGDVNDLEKKINGIAPEKVTADSVETKFGPFKGGYYPISFDTRQSWRQRVLFEGETAQDLFGGQWARAMTRHGHTIERTNSGGKPLFLDLSVLTQHVENVIHDLSYRKAVIDASRLLEDDATMQAIQGAAGNKAIDEIQTWIRSIAGDRQKGHVAWFEGLLRRARGGATTVNLGFKVTSGLVQTLGYLNTVREIGPKYSALGLKEVFRNGANLKKTWAFISEKSAEMRYRLTNYDRDVRDTMRKLNVAGTEPGVLGVMDAYTADARESFFFFVGFMDLATSVPTWLGAYQKALDGKVEGLWKADENSAVLYADKIVRETQSAGDIMDLSRIQRGNDLMKMFTMFYSQASLQFNQFNKTIGEYKMTKDMPRLAASMMLLWFVPAVLEEAIRGRGPGDDDEWLKWLAKNEMAYPFQTAIFLRDIVSGMERQGYEPSPAFEAYKALTKSAQAISNRTLGEKDELTRADIKNMVNTVGYFTALPTRQTWQTIEYFYDWMTGNEQPDNAVEGVWRALVTGKPKG